MTIGTTSCVSVIIKFPAATAKFKLSDMPTTSLNNYQTYPQPAADLLRVSKFKITNIKKISIIHNNSNYTIQIINL